MTRDESILEQLPPEKLLDTRKTRVITPAIEMMEEVATVELYLEHERKNRDRPGIIRYLTDRIDAICEANDEIPPSSQDQDEDTIPTDDAGSISPMSPPEEALAYIHDIGEEPAGKIGSSPSLPTWDEL
jgi:hypothetical protein